MNDTQNIRTIRFSVYRAVDNERVCQKFIEGHIHVLKVYGITHITSAKIDWILNPNVYVLIAEDPDSREVLAGARVHVADLEHTLPIEDAIGHKDSNVYPYVEELRSNGGTGEFCGLWNSRKIAGYGVGSMFLGETSIAIASQLNISTMVGLCAPITKKRSFKLGFTQATNLGNNGEFIYPKEDLVATALYMPDVMNLSHADEEEREKIMMLRSKPNQSMIVETRRGEVNIEYNLEIPNITSIHTVEL